MTLHGDRVAKSEREHQVCRLLHEETLPRRQKKWDEEAIRTLLMLEHLVVENSHPSLSCAD